MVHKAKGINTLLIMTVAVIPHFFAKLATVLEEMQPYQQLCG